MKAGAIHQVQKGILALLLHSHRFFDNFIGILKAEYFPTQIERLLFAAINDYHTTYQIYPSFSEFVIFLDATRGTIITELAAYLDGMPDPDELNEDFYMEFVMEFARKAELKRVLREAHADIEDGNIQAVVDRVIKVYQQTERIDTLPDSWVNEFEDRARRKLDESKAVRILTGFPYLDDVTHGGLKKGQVGMVAADYGQGKSIVMMNLAKSAFYYGHKVLFITLACELDKDEQAYRMDCLVSRVPIHKYEDQFETIYNRIEEIKALKGDLKMVELIDREWSIADLRSMLLRYRRSGWIPDMVCIDYIDIIAPSTQSAGEKEHTTIENIWRDFKSAAKEFNFVGWSASQLNAEEEVAKSRGKKGVIDFGVKLLAEPPEKAAGYMRCVCVKNRNGRDIFSLPLKKNGEIFEIVESGMTYNQHVSTLKLDEYWEQKRSSRRFKK